MFGTDKDLESGAGVTIDLGGVKFTIHRAGGSNRKYAQVLSAKVAPYRRQMQANTLDEAVSTKLMAEVYADTIIIGWEGVLDDKGKKVPYTRENVINALIEYPELFQFIQEEAGRVANFRREELEAEEKNSVKS